MKTGLLPYKFGIDGDWKGKLFYAGGTVDFPNLRIAEGDAPMLKRLESTLGPHTRETKEEYLVLGDRYISEDNLFVWEKPGTTVTFSNSFDEKSHTTYGEVKCWDSKFYSSHDLAKFY